MDRGRRVGKTAEERELKVQSPIGASGVLLHSKKRRHVGKKDVLMAHILEQLNKSNNEECKQATALGAWIQGPSIIQGMQMMRVPFRKWKQKHDLGRLCQWRS